MVCCVCLGVVEGQIYIPEANWAMMVLTLLVVAGFRDPLAISNAYGAHLLKLFNRLQRIANLMVTSCPRSQ